MNAQNLPKTEREIAQAKVASARSNLLLMIVFTLVNIGLMLFNADVFLLFSASVPYFAVSIGVASEMTPVLIITLIFAASVLLGYFLCWLGSKKNHGWMIAALVLFILDSLVMIALYIFTADISGILDVVIHAWVLYYLIIGVKYGHRLQNLPQEPIEVIDETVPQEESPVVGNSGFEYSSPLRRADENVKHRVLLESDALGHHVCYRRVKRINELVIDGYVYDEIEILIETAHALNAKIEGHTFQVGFDGMAHSYLRVDGETVAKKLRLV